MDEIPISKFKATCAAVIAGVARSRRRVGKPIVEIVPHRSARSKRSWLRCMAGTAEIVGDIAAPSWPDWRRDLEHKMDRRMKHVMPSKASDR